MAQAAITTDVACRRGGHAAAPAERLPKPQVSGKPPGVAMMKTFAATLIAAMFTAACACPSAAPSPGTGAELVQAFANPARTEAFRARDRYRHPRETLEFFDVTPEMTLVEIWPGQGWYTEILAPYLRDHGHYYAAGYVVSAEQSPQWRKDDAAEFAAKLKAAPQLYDKVIVTELGLPDRWEMAPPGSADRVLTFRNIHNWIAGGYEQQMFAAMSRALKPGGIAGVVEHRANPGATLAQMKQSGYVTEAYVIQLAESAGLKLQARSEINANPKDSKDYAQGVWTLPPTLKLGDQDRQKYLDIGESDRMTLRFVKPLLVAPKNPA
jgi:predicted methyltransferase